MFFKLMIFSGRMSTVGGGVVAAIGILPALTMHDFRVAICGAAATIGGLVLEFVGGWGRFFQRP